MNPTPDEKVIAQIESKPEKSSVQFIDTADSNVRFTTSIFGLASAVTSSKTLSNIENVLLFSFSSVNLHYVRSGLLIF